MFDEIKDEYQRVEKDQVGERFKDRYRRRSKQRKKLSGRIRGLFYIPLGILITFFGLVQSLIPGTGPGSVVVIVGLVLLAGEFKFIARFLDRAEVYARKHIFDPFLQWWQHGNPYLRAIFVIIAGCVLLFWLLYLLPHGAQKSYNKVK